MEIGYYNSILYQKQQKKILPSFSTTSPSGLFSIDIMTSTGWKLKKENWLINYFLGTNAKHPISPTSPKLLTLSLPKRLNSSPMCVLVCPSLKNKNDFISLLEWASIILQAQTNLTIKEIISCKHFQAHCFDLCKMFTQVNLRIHLAKTLMMILQLSKVSSQQVKRPLLNARQLFYLLVFYLTNTYSIE